jgi:deoxyribonuclease IV
MERYFGCHVSVSGGLANALRTASLLNINTIQIHPCPPQRWNTSPFAPGIEEEYLKLLPQSGVKKVFFHGIYLINLANPDKRLTNLARLSLMHDLDLLGRLGGAGVIFHVGSMVHDPSEESSFARAAESINHILDSADNGTPLLLEVAAGSGAVIGQRFEQLSKIYSLVDKQERVGFALDTQHLWASGCDIGEKLDDLLHDIETLVGIEKVKAIHLNDSKSAFGSRIDRHENIGQGTIGRDILSNFIHHPKLREIPIILETPALKSVDTMKGEVEVLRDLIGQDKTTLEAASI